MQTCVFGKLAFLALLCASQAFAADEIRFGLGALQESAYLGASEQKTRLIPLLDMNKNVGKLGSSAWDFYARTSRGYGEAGFRTALLPNFRVGFQAGLESGRDPKDHSVLLKKMNLPEIKTTLGTGMHAEWFGKVGPAPMALVLRWRSRTSEARGHLIDLRYDTGLYQSGAFGMGAFAQLTQASRDAMQSDFGVTPAQAALGGVAAYSASAGLRDSALGLQAQYDLTPKFQLVASVKRSQLHAAAKSPVVEKSQSVGAAAGFLWQW